MALPAIPPYPLPGPADLPAGPAPWRPDPRRATLLVHDMQRYFTAPFAGAPLPEVVARIGTLRRACAAAGIPVIYTAQPGGQPRAERGLLADFWGAGLPADPAAAAIVAELAPAADDTVVTKRRYSAFAGTGLADRLAGRDQLVITGVYAHIGVLATACDAFMRDIEPFVVADAVADFSAAHHRRALRYAAQRCAAVTTADAVAGALAGVPA
ncbi:MAG TPA: isochorismatase family protein [Pilimelia sp.]|nr:isochorismatase family protein [Pilimelia sp.]